jgi:hypothetical protein
VTVRAEITVQEVPDAAGQRMRGQRPQREGE